MQSPIRQLSLPSTTIIVIGITAKTLQLTTPVGRHLTSLSQFTIHARLDGVFQIAATMVYGLRLDLAIRHTTTQIKEYLSVYHLLLQLGILLRVFAPIQMAVSPLSTISATSATIGQLLHANTVHTPCTSAVLAISGCHTVTPARSVIQSVVSKSQNNLQSHHRCLQLQSWPFWYGTDDHPMSARHHISRSNHLHPHARQPLLHRKM